MRRFAVVVVAALVLAVVATGCARTLAGGGSGTFVPNHRGVLTVATNLPAPGFWEGSTAASVHGGFEYGIALEMAKRFDLGRVRVVDEPFSAITAERERHEQFSIPYWDSNLGVLVRRGTNVPDLATARAQRWAYQTGTTSQTFISDVIRPSRPSRGDTDLHQVLAALSAGKVDAVLLDLPLALVEAGHSGGRLAVAAQFVTGDRYGVVLPEDSPNREPVDAALRAMQADGTIDQLAARWLVPAFGQSPNTVPAIQFQA